MITMNFGSFKEYNMNNRFFNMNLAGGAMLDIGVYALSIVRSFMDEKPDEILSQWKPSPTGSDEQATILLKNHSGQMATVALSLHSKQPKRAMISCEKGYIEIMEYPRADKAVIVDAETGEKTEISCGDTSDALLYEMEDMEHAVLTHDNSGLYLNYTKDVMDIMTYLRKEWNMKYPDETGLIFFGYFCLFMPLIPGHCQDHADKNNGKHGFQADAFPDRYSCLPREVAVTSKRLIYGFIPVHRKKLRHLQDVSVHNIHGNKHATQKAHSKRQNICNPA